MSWPLSQDYNEAIQDPRTSFNDAELKTGEAAANALGIPMPRSGNFADVYEVRCRSGSRWAVKCFTREVFGLRERYAEIGKYLRLAKLPFMVDFQYLEQGIRVRGQWYPILKMQWVEGFLLNEFVRDNLDKKPILQALGQIWLKMARRLRESYIAHCDLQHGNVLFVPGSSASSLAVKLIDYDGMCVPSLVGTKSGEVGHPAYQHPERLRSGAYDQEVDRFALLSIATALRCLSVGGRSLWKRYDTGDNLLFRQSDLQAPARSPLFQELRAIGDAQSQLLVKELQRACQGALDGVPLLTDLVPELSAPSAVKPAGSKRTSVVKTVAAQVSPTAETTADSSAWDFEGEDEPGSRRRRKGGLPRWVWGAAAVCLAGLVLAGGIVALGLRSDPDKPKDTEGIARNDKKPPKSSSQSPTESDSNTKPSDGNGQQNDDPVVPVPPEPNSPEAPVGNVPPNENKADGFVSLFNGKNLDGWKSHPKQPSNWRVEKGSNGNVLTSSGAVSSILYSERGDYKDFRLRVEARINDSGSGGVYIRAPFGPQLGHNPDFPVGYEAQIDGTRRDNNKTGSLYVSADGSLFIDHSAQIPPGQWFWMEVIAQGDRIIVKVNDKTTADYQDKGRRFSSGHIALEQLGGAAEVEFRKIEIKELPTKETVTPPESVEVLTPAQAAGKVGQKVTVQLHVQQTSSKSEGFLEMFSEEICDGAGNSFFLRFPESTRKKFDQLGISDVARNFYGKLVRVTGTVTTFRFKEVSYSCIVIDDPDQIKELPGKVASSVLPAPPAKEATSLFNEKDLTGWEGLAGFWQAKDGCIVGEPPEGQKVHTFLCSTKTYRDFDLKFRVRRDESIGNSGVQFRSQIKDADKYTVVGPQCEIDSLTNAFPPGSLVTEPTGDPLRVKPSAAALAELAKVYTDDGFNDFHIRCVGKHVTIKVNNIVTVDDDFPSLPDEGIIAWQLHGGRPPKRLWFRIVEFTELSEAHSDGFVSLFNGRNLAGWEVNEGGKRELWSADNDVLSVTGSGGWLMTEKEYRDFELRLEFKLAEKANSGVALRSAMKGSPAGDAGMEIQLVDDDWYKKNLTGMKPEGLTGSIWGIVPPSRNALKPVGAWNAMRIVAKGRNVTVVLNGVEIVKANLDAFKSKVGAHAGMLRTTGRLGLQSSDGRVDFRKIEVKELLAKPDEPLARPEPRPQFLEAKDVAAKTYEKTCVAARASLLKAFDIALNQLAKSKGSTEARLTMIQIVKEEKERFKNSGLIPWSEPMRQYVERYFGVLATAQGKLSRVYESLIDAQLRKKNESKVEELRAELKNRLDIRLMARWQHFANGRNAGIPRLYSNGRIGNSEGKATWTYNKGVLTYRWPNPQAPQGAWIDTLTISSDGKTYAGTNNNPRREFRPKLSGVHAKDD